tara:strand:- start:546 stop:650 length:105 start_codon:yes stop_codon:yes gene_type:complete
MLGVLDARAVKATLRCKKHIAFALEKYWIYFDKI